MDFVGLLEIIVKELYVSKCFNKFVNGWNWVNKYIKVLNGRIWVLWRNNIEVEVFYIYE